MQSITYMLGNMEHTHTLHGLGLLRTIEASIDLFRALSISVRIPPPMLSDLILKVHSES